MGTWANMTEDKYGLFVGAETGLLKGVNIETKKWSNINRVEEVNRENEINIMRWKDESESQICIGTRSHQISTFDATSNELISSMECSAGEGPFRGLGSIDGDFITCTESGLVKVWREDPSDQVQFEVGPDIYRMKQSKWKPNLIATGGKENDLRIYDIADSLEEPSFRAKNVRDDWLCLRVPVWITDIEFVPGCQRIITSTGHHQVRMYDPATSQRRPVLDMTFDEHPIITMSLRSNENQVVVGNTQGSVALLDLRGKGHMVQRYKGFAGSVRCVQCHPTENVVAACGLDRFVRIYDIDTKLLLHKFYLKSRLNCLLMSSAHSFDVENPGVIKTIAKKKSTDEETSEISAEDETLWDNMPVVHTKKLKRKPKHEKFESDISEIGNSSSKKKSKKGNPSAAITSSETIVESKKAKRKKVKSL